jgi:CheY-like chemotaxis protein
VQAIERLEALHTSQADERAAAERVLCQVFFHVTGRSLELSGPFAYGEALGAIEKAFLVMRQAAEPAPVRTDAGNQPPPATLIPGGIPPEGRLMQILVVEDEAILRQFVIDGLQEAGYEVFDEASAETAPGLEIQFAPAVVVTNVNLARGMNGFEYAEAVRKKWPSIGIVYVGRRSNFKGRSPAPTERFLRKPFEITALLAAIEDVTARGAIHPRKPSRPRGRGR